MTPPLIELRNVKKSFGSKVVLDGVNLTIEQLTWADWLSQCWVDKDYQMTMMNFFTLWESDFLYYSVWNSTGAFNYRAINDPAIDDLTTKARSVVDDAERARPRARA